MVIASVRGLSRDENEAHAVLRRLFTQRFLDHPQVLALHRQSPGFAW